MKLRVALVALTLTLTGCSLFTKENARTANDIARDLCALHALEVKPGISAEEIAESFCKDVQPWIDVVLAMKRTGVQQPAPAP